MKNSWNRLSDNQGYRKSSAGRWKRLTALGMGVMLLAGTLTGCGSPKEEKQPDAAGDTAVQETAKAGGEKIQLRYATGDSGPAVTVQEIIVKAFNESQDQIEVKLETYGTAFDQKLAAAIGSDNAPDIVKMWNFPAYYESLVPLQDKIDSLEDKDDFYATLFNYADMNGNIYGMPIGFSTRAIHYNKDLTDAAGITINEDWTMEDLKAAAAATTKDGVTGLYFYYNPDPYALESILWSNGGEWLNDSGEPVINSDANKEALQFLHDMIYKDKIAYTGNRNDDFGQAMGSGNYAFGEMGKWFVSAINEAGINLGITTMPKFEGGESMSVVHASFLSVTNGSKNQDAAWEFIKYYTNYESVKTLCEIEMPVRESVAKDTGLLDDPQMAPFYTMLERSEAKRPSLVKSAQWPEVNSEIDAGLEAIFAQEDADVAAVLDEVQTKVEAIIQ